jgi:hypothetical protein
MQPFILGLCLINTILVLEYGVYIGSLENKLEIERKIINVLKSYKK